MSLLPSAANSPISKQESDPFPYLLELESLISNNDQVSKLLDQINHLSFSFYHAANTAYTKAPIVPLSDSSVPVVPVPTGPETLDPIDFASTVQNLAKDITNQTRSIVDQISEFPAHPMNLDSFGPIHDQLISDSKTASAQLSKSVNAAKSLLKSVQSVRCQITDLELDKHRQRALIDLEREKLKTFNALHLDHIHHEFTDSV